MLQMFIVGYVCLGIVVGVYLTEKAVQEEVKRNTKFYIHYSIAVAIITCIWIFIAAASIAANMIVVKYPQKAVDLLQRLEDWKAWCEKKSAEQEAKKNA